MASCYELMDKEKNSLHNTNIIDKHFFQMPLGFPWKPLFASWIV